MRGHRGPCTRLNVRKKTKTTRHISKDKKKKKMSIVLYPYNGQVDEVPRPVEETTETTSISTEGAFLATSDVSDVVATGVKIPLRSEIPRHVSLVTCVIGDTLEILDMC